MQRMIHLVKTFSQWLFKGEPPPTLLRSFGGLLLTLSGLALFRLADNYPEEYDDKMLYIVGYGLLVLGVLLMGRKVAIIFLIGTILSGLLFVALE